MRMVVDRLEGRAVRRRAADEPLGATVVDFPIVMTFANRLFDLAVIELALSKALVARGPSRRSARSASRGSLSRNRTGFGQKWYFRPAGKRAMPEEGLEPPTRGL
jgi:hypothetical protein